MEDYMMWGKARQGNLYDWITRWLARFCGLLRMAMLLRGVKRKHLKGSLT